jgi:hypothetical protein
LDSTARFITRTFSVSRNRLFSVLLIAVLKPTLNDASVRLMVPRLKIAAVAKIARH